MMRFALVLAMWPVAALADITVFAAASLKTALDEAVRLYEGEAVTLSYAGSSALARQIGYGAPADLFISANPDWIDWLDAEGLVTQQAPLLGNRLVLIGPAGAESGPPEALLPGAERIAMALVDAVPAGIYGKQAMTSLGLWDQVAPRVVQADNVRAALALVALGEAPLGVVYATDAQAEPRVTVLAEFPEHSHAPIRYPAALLDGHGTGAQAFYDWLQGDEAAQVFQTHGFSVLGAQ